MKLDISQFDWSLHPDANPTGFDAVSYVRGQSLLNDITNSEQRLANTLQQNRLVLFLSDNTVLDWWMLTPDPDSAQRVR
jgi:hypothetical protein